MREGYAAFGKVIGRKIARREGSKQEEPFRKFRERGAPWLHQTNRDLDTSRQVITQGVCVWGGDKQEV